MVGLNNFVTSPKNTQEDPNKAYSRTNEEIFVVGNGRYATPSSDKNRSNALIVLRNGNTGIDIPSDYDNPANSKPTEKLDVNGNIRIRGAISGTLIESECKNPGTITFYEDNFYGCKSTGWVKLNP